MTNPPQDPTPELPEETEITDVQAAYAEQERRNKEYFESKLENYH